MNELENIKNRIKEPLPDLDYEEPEVQREPPKMSPPREPTEIPVQHQSPQKPDLTDLETPKPRESPLKMPKPPSLNRPKKSSKRPLEKEQIIVYKNWDITNIISTLRQETGGKNKKSEIDERRFISLKSQLSSLISKNNALLDIQKRQK